MTALLAVRRLAIPEVVEFTPRRFGDDRGYFVEQHNAARFAEAGFPLRFVQVNQSRSVARHTLRGLHYQTPPMAQDKLVWVVRGSVIDIAVDIRAGSPTYGKSVSVTLSAETGNQVLVPVGFAHGFVTLEPETLVQYMVTNPYSAANDAGIRWDDPDLAVDWQLGGATPTLSARDTTFPSFAELKSPFRYTGAAS